MCSLAERITVFFVTLSICSCLAISNNAEKIKETYSLIMIINYPYQIWSEDPTKIHVTLLKPDFSPAAGAEVTVNGKIVGKADPNGICIFDYRPGNQQRHLLEARLVEKGIEYKTGKSFACYSRTVSFKAERLYVYTDRGVYNPGQEILIRILAWELKKEYTAIPEAKIQLLFQDLQGKIYSGEYVLTNEYGMGSSKISLPEHIQEGDYDLVVLYGEARESTRIRIKRFIPPVINIRHNLARFFTSTQESLSAAISLSYFSGGTLSAARLIFSIHTAQDTEVFSREYSSQTPEFRLEFDKSTLDVLRKKLSPETEIKVKLKASDSYGQTDEIVWDMFYTEQPFFAVLEADKDAYPQGEEVALLVKVVDLDGQPAKEIPLTLAIDALPLSLQGKTDAEGVASFRFTMPANTVTVLVKSPIMAKPLGQRVIPWEVPKPMISKVKEPPQLAGTKASIIVYFDPGYIPIEKVVHIDLTDISGALVAASAIPIIKRGESYSAEGEISAPTWGTMLVNLYCCAIKKEQSKMPYTPETVGFITEGQHVTFYADRELKITVENFKPDYAPGEKASFTITVQGGRGEKCLGIAIVDEAVLSLLDPFLKNPVKHFYSPQAKVIATGGAGVLTWPVVDRNWGYPWRDIAYSNWGWKDPGSFIDTIDDLKSSESEEALGPPGEESGGVGGGPDYKEKSAEAPLAEVSPDGDRNRTVADKKTVSTTKIIIRNYFPETCLWEPSLLTKQGKAQIQILLPHEITTQKLSIIASDKEGYLGFVQKEIKVTQPLFIRSLFPKSLIQGDRIRALSLVRNLGDSEHSCRAFLESTSLALGGNNSQTLTLKAGESRMLEWEISAPRCGKGTYRISIETDGFKDIENKEIVILPAGEPTLLTLKQDITSQERFEKRFTVSPDADYTIATLNISLPNVFPAFQAYQAYDLAPWYTPWAVSAAVIMNAALLEYTNKITGYEEYRYLLLERLKESAALLVLNQLASGAWGWYPVGALKSSEPTNDKDNANLYYTVSCLKALCEIVRSGIKVDPNVIVRAANYILNCRHKNGLWISSGAYFWEVNNEETDLALSAEIFACLMDALSLIPEMKAMAPEIRTLKGVMLELVGEKITEPLTIAAAVQGLKLLRDYYKDFSLDTALQNGIKHLINLKRRGYWEPHWYHAYGGMVELNARILTLLALFDAEAYKAYLREGITWLLSTQEAWGTWHNEIGTAEAVRALLKCGAFAAEKPSVIAITVNNKEIAHINVDPEDPFLSAAKLSFLEISPWVLPGENSVAVTYNGALTASVILEVKEWAKSIPAGKDAIALIRTAAAKAALGQAVEVKLSLSSQKNLPFILIEEGIPSNCEVDLRSLEDLIRKHKITGYVIRGAKLCLSIAGFKGKAELVYTLLPVWQGESNHGGTRIIDATSNTLLTYVGVSPFVVK
jgi:hypothetical protein